MNRFLVYFSLFVMCTLARAGEDQIHLIHPKGSDLKLVQLKKDDGLFAKFKGQVWITGTFVGRWPYGASNKAFETPYYYLLPDVASIAKLPYFELKDPPYNNSYRVKTIDLKNGEAALRMTVSEEEAKRLLQRKVNKVRVTGKFLIEAYVVGVECDSPWASANLVKYERPDNLAARLKESEGC